MALTAEEQSAQLLQDFMDARKNPPKIHPDSYAANAISRYPDVPEPHALTWDYSDSKRADNPEREQALNSAADALEHAAQICRDIKDSTDFTTPNILRRQTSIISQAIHAGEELLSDLLSSYPLPDYGSYSIVNDSKELEKYAPKLLLNEPNHIIIWMHSLPEKSMRANNLIYAELRGLLQQHRLHHIKQWHCDFIHVHPEDKYLGVRDVDNYPYKPIIDALALALCALDSGEHFSCSMYNLASNTIKHGCYISITERSEKVGFFKDFENLLNAL